MSHQRIFDTKNVVKQVADDTEYINYGTLYQALKKEITLLKA